MATIYKEFSVEAPARFVWEAIKDVASVHTRLAEGFVTDTALEGDTRTVTFANGFIVKEQIIAKDDSRMRMAYHAVGGRTSHHNASFQVIPLSENVSRVLWITDLLPDEVKSQVAQMVEAGSTAMKATLERGFHKP